MDGDVKPKRSVSDLLCCSSSVETSDSGKQHHILYLELSAKMAALHRRPRPAP